MSDQDTWVRRLGVTPEHLIGYPYAGLLAGLLIAIVNPDGAKKTVEALGPVLSPLVAIGTGSAIFALYFRVVGELFLYPAHHLFHGFLDWCRGRTNERHTSSTAYLGYLGVPFGHRRMAYEAVKALCIPTELRTRIWLNHGEIHVLYLTAVETSIAACYIRLQTKESLAESVGSPLLWFLVSGIALIAGIAADVRQHSMETHLMKGMEEKVVEFLRQGEYLRLEKDI